VVRLCFHERRLQYMEREQIAAWRMSRPGDRIVEIDVPLSYGIYDVVQDNNNLNVVEFFWDPTKEVGVYIKVNCISTEFTPKKHGGEKGVPFRIQVETYSHGDGDGTPKRLHVAGCQIKVFKVLCKILITAISLFGCCFSLTNSAPICFLFISSFLYSAVEGS